MNTKFTLGVIGAGNMANAIVSGAIKKLLKPNEIIISDKDETKLENFKKLGFTVTTDNVEVVKNSENLLFAVKPQIAPIVFEDIKGKIEAKTVISIMAGINIDTLEKNLGSFNFVRVMPNTPAMLGEGMSALAFKGNFENKDFIMNLFGSLGKAVELDEKHFDAVTSVSGSGPAYVYMFIKAMIDGGIDGGLTAETAKTLTLQTIIGACKMVETSPKQIDELIDAVCSKGGTTIEAVNSYRNDDLNGIIRKGIAKCKKRSEELSRG